MSSTGFGGVDGLGRAGARGRDRGAGGRRVSAAGRLERAAGGLARSAMEQLEPRILLGGDHPSFALPLSSIGATVIPIVSGQGAVGGVIDPALDNDVFQFVAPANDLVSVWADALNLNSALNSRVEVYAGDGTLLKAGSNDGTLTGGLFRDGRAVFKAAAGTTYYVRVLSDIPSGTGSTGAYTVRVNTSVTNVPVDNGTGVATTPANITLNGRDQLFRFDVPAGAIFDSVASGYAATDGFVDPRLDIYDSQGNLLKGDSQDGRLNDAFLVFGSNVGGTFYARARSDEFALGAIPAVGTMTITMDFAATSFAIDHVTRTGLTVGAAGDIVHDLTTFQAQGTGLTIAHMLGVGLPPTADPALRMYNRQGQLIGFSDDAFGAQAQIKIQLTGGEHYFLVAEDFDTPQTGTYAVTVETNHTINTQPLNGSNVDDHANLPAAGGTQQERRRAFEQATPIVLSDVLSTSSQPFASYFTGLDPLYWNDPTPPPPIPNKPNPVQNEEAVVFGQISGRIEGAGDTDIFMFVPPVDMLGIWEGHRQQQNQYFEIDPEPPRLPVLGGLPHNLHHQGEPRWSPFMRPSRRLQLVATPDFDASVSLSGIEVRIYAPDFSLLDEGGPLLNQVLGLPTGIAPNSVGWLDPSSYEPQLISLPFGTDPFTFAGGLNGPGLGDSPELWGGYPYFIEVSGPTTGRYNIWLQLDSMPPDDGSNVHPDPFNDLHRQDVWLEQFDRGQWPAAREIVLQQSSGDGRFLGGFNNSIDTSAGTERARVLDFNIVPLGLDPFGLTTPLGPTTWTAPGTVGILEEGLFGSIELIEDTDLYRFTASSNGSAEVRINTTQIADQFNSVISDFSITDDVTNTNPPVVPDVITGSKAATWDSWLNSGLRIFDNDFEQVAYANENTTLVGDEQPGSIGVFNRTFHRRDARVVFNVEAGKTYFIQVESGQLPAFQAAMAAANNVRANADFSLLDWRRATGSYELLVNTMPDLQFDDDHANTTGVFSTVFPLDPSTGTGQITGTIANTLANPLDEDVFELQVPATGVATISVVPAGSLLPSLTVLDQTLAVVAQASATTSAGVQVSFAADAGSILYLVVGASAGTQGAYTVSVSGLADQDEHPGLHELYTATRIPVLDFLGTGTVSGSINEFGDIDTFYFETGAFDIATLTVTGSTPGFNPRVQVFEIGLDTILTAPSAVYAVANPIPLRVGLAEDTDGDQSATTRFSISAPNRVATHPTQQNVFNRYYVVVSGLDVATDKGAYDLNLVVNPTDDHPDALEWDFASTIPVVASTGLGDATGVLETSADSDLFRFLTPAGGPMTLSVTSPSTSTLRPTIRVFDVNRQPITDLGTGGLVVTGPDTSVSTATFTFNGQRNATYYVLIDGVVGGTVKTTDTGEYLINAETPTADDHANITEFGLATQIGLNTTNGDGQGSGLLEIAKDTDLFFFDSIEVGAVQLTVATPASDLNPVVRVYNSGQTLIRDVTDGGVGDLDGVQNGSVTVSVSPTAIGQRFFVLASSDPVQPTRTGAYLVQIDGPAPVVPPPTGDDHANAGQWLLATAVLLSQVNGDGSVTGLIEQGGDTDLFRFTSLSDGRVFVDVTTPAGSLLDARVRIYNSSFQLLVEDALGIPGNDAYALFSSTAAGQDFFIEVSGLGNGTGSYAVRVDAEPEMHMLVFPEGFAADSISQFVSIINPNTFSVDYTITAHFESPALSPLVVGTGTVAGGLRSGATLSDRFAGGAQGALPENAPYSLVITSTGQLGATFAHYDFGLSLGEAFTGQFSKLWSFAQVERNPGAVFDFVVFYNPGPTAAEVTLSVFGPNGPIQFAQVVGAGKRGGWNINATGVIPVGGWGATVTSKAADGSNNHIGVVASLSHYDTAAKSGYSLLGDPQGGATRGALPSLTSSAALKPEIEVFNANASPATITLTGDYVSSGLPNFTRIFTIPARSSISLSATQLGLVQNQPAGFRYVSDRAITVAYSEGRTTDAQGSLAQSQLATTYFFGDGFINADGAGSQYLETLSFYNPDQNALPITVRLFFSDGDEFVTTVNVGANTFGVLQLHDLPIFQQRGGLNFFSMQTSASRPFAVNFVHTDLFLGGVFGTSGAPLGLLNSLANI